MMSLRLVLACFCTRLLLFSIVAVARTATDKVAFGARCLLAHAESLWTLSVEEHAHGLKAIGEHTSYGHEAAVRLLLWLFRYCKSSTAYLAVVQLDIAAYLEQEDFLKVPVALRNVLVRGLSNLSAQARHGLSSGVGVCVPRFCDVLECDLPAVLLQYFARKQGLRQEVAVLPQPAWCEGANVTVGYWPAGSEVAKVQANTCDDPETSGCQLLSGFSFGWSFGGNASAAPSDLQRRRMPRWAMQGAGAQPEVHYRARSMPKQTSWREPPIELVTVTNDANRARRLLQNSPLPVRVLGPLGRTASDWGQAPFSHLKNLHLLLYVRDLIQKGRNNTVVIFMDAWDVAYLGCGRDLLRSFRALRRPLFFSAELGAYPFGLNGFVKWRQSGLGDYPCGNAGPSFHALKRCSRSRNPNLPCRAWHRASSQATKGSCEFCVPASLGGGYRFLNSGCWGGYAWAIERALSRIYEFGHMDKFMDKLEQLYGYRDENELVDQIMWTLYMSTYHHEIALDYGASICLSLHGFDLNKDFFKRIPRAPSILNPLHRNAVIQPSPYWNARIFAVPFGKDVCFAHAMGNKKDDLETFLTVSGLPGAGQIFSTDADLFSYRH